MSRDWTTTTTKLRQIGWPIAVSGSPSAIGAAAVTDFQRGFSFRNLSIDGDPGPQTMQALADAIAQGGRCGPHFRYAEFKSGGNGWIKVNRELVRGLEVLRANVGGPLKVVSGYRDPAHNQAVGGATNSQHLYGNACDVEQKWSLNLVRNLHRFSGIGIVRASGLVAHVDVRGMPDHNTTGGTAATPTTWYYG